MTLENRSSRFLTRSDTSRSMQPQEMARSLKFQISEEEGLYYQCSQNKGTDRHRSYSEAGLCLCFCLCKLFVFPWGDSFDNFYFDKWTFEFHMGCMWDKAAKPIVIMKTHQTIYRDFLKL